MDFLYIVINVLKVLRIIYLLFLVANEVLHSWPVDNVSRDTIAKFLSKPNAVPRIWDNLCFNDFDTHESLQYEMFVFY